MPERSARGWVRSIDANRTIKDELTIAVRGQSGRRRISVTDLVNPRQAFFRWTRPDIVPSASRLQAMMTGTGFHARLGQAISTEEFVEQFVEWEGIVGKIDLYEDMPVEVKTTSVLPEDVALVRPSYVDQLAMYSAMTAAASGRLLIFQRGQFGRIPELRAYRLRFADHDAVRTEMTRRRNLFQRALETKAPSALPQCEWFGRSCDYETICGCAAAEPCARIAPPSVFDIGRDVEAERRLSDRLATVTHEVPVGFRLNDIVFPRKAAYEHQLAGGPAEDEQEESLIESRLRDLERQGLLGALKRALRFGIRGAFQTVPVRLRTLTGRVGTFRGTPTLLRATRLRQMIERDRLPYVMTHYFDRMAFESALIGNDQSRLVVYYENLPDDKFMVYDVRFRDLSVIQAELDRRLGLLESGALPHDLPACPTWMSKFCTFAPGCGCGNPPTS